MSYYNLLLELAVSSVPSVMWAVLGFLLARWALVPDVLKSAPSADVSGSGNSDDTPGTVVNNATPSSSQSTGAHDARDEKCIIRPVGEQSSAFGASPGQGVSEINLLSKDQIDKTCASPESHVSGGGSVGKPATPDQESRPPPVGDAASSPRGGGAYSVEDNMAGERSLEEVKADLEKLVGLQEVKTWVRKLEASLKNTTTHKSNLHMIFYGPPGTGKTTAARIVAELMHFLDALPPPKDGHKRTTFKPVSVQKNDIYSGIVSKTGKNMRRKIEEAIQGSGVLFIDEAYDLSQKEGDNGMEAVMELMESLEKDYERLVVILAGYRDNMERFLTLNKGLESRFPRHLRIDFKPYSAEELIRIFCDMMKERKDDAERPIASADKTAESASFEDHLRLYLGSRAPLDGNARSVRVLFERVWFVATQDHTPGTALTFHPRHLYEEVTNDETRAGELAQAEQRLLSLRNEMTAHARKLESAYGMLREPPHIFMCDEAETRWSRRKGHAEPLAIVKKPGSALHDVDVVQFISEASVLLKPVPNMDGTLSPNHSISELVVQGQESLNRASDEGPPIRVLATALQPRRSGSSWVGNSSLWKLELKGNKGVVQVDSAGAAALADALSPKMQEGKWIFFGALTHLSLAGNCIRDSGAKALAKILEPLETSGGNSPSFSKLEYIDLSDNDIGNEGGMALLSALEPKVQANGPTTGQTPLVNSTLKELVLDGNPLGASEDKLQDVAKRVSSVRNGGLDYAFQAGGQEKRLDISCINPSINVQLALLERTRQILLRIIRADVVEELMPVFDRTARRWVCNGPVTQLILKGNTIGGEGGKAIAAALEPRKNPDGSWAFNTALNTLNLFSNHMRVEGGKAIAAALEPRKNPDGSWAFNTALNTLGLYGNNIGDEVGKAIAAALEPRKNPDGSWAFNTALNSLNLSRNTIGVEGGKAIAAALEPRKNPDGSWAFNPALNNLNLECNDIGVEGGKAIAAALEPRKNPDRSWAFNTALNTLNLFSNNIGDEGGKAIAAALEPRKNPDGSWAFNPALNTLSLSSINIGGEGGKAIAAALEPRKNPDGSWAFNTALNTLNLFSNDIGDEGGKAIAAALEPRKNPDGSWAINTALNNLNLEWNGIAEYVMDNIKSALQNMKEHRG